MLQQKMMVTVNNTCSSVSHDTIDDTLVLNNDVTSDN